MNRWPHKLPSIYSVPVITAPIGHLARISLSLRERIRETRRSLATAASLARCVRRSVKASVAAVPSCDCRLPVNTTALCRPLIGRLTVRAGNVSLPRRFELSAQLFLFPIRGVAFPSHLEALLGSTLFGPKSDSAMRNVVAPLPCGPHISVSVLCPFYDSLQRA